MGWDDLGWDGDGMVFVWWFAGLGSRFCEVAWFDAGWMHGLGHWSGLDWVWIGYGAGVWIEGAWEFGWLMGIGYGGWAGKGVGLGWMDS